MKFILVIAIFTLSLSCVAGPVAAKKTLPVPKLDISKIKLPKEEPKKEELIDPSIVQLQPSRKWKGITPFLILICCFLF